MFERALYRPFGDLSGAGGMNGGRGGYADAGWNRAVVADNEVRLKVQIVMDGEIQQADRPCLKVFDDAAAAFVPTHAPPPSTPAKSGMASAPSR